MYLYLLQAAGGQKQPMWMTLIFFAVIIMLFWLFFIRPQNKRQKALQAKRDALGVGDSIMTAGGIYGRIREVRERTLIVEIAHDVKIEIEKSSVYPATTE